METLEKRLEDEWGGSREQHHDVGDVDAGHGSVTVVFV